MTQQPKALQLADELEMWTQGEPAAAELRRQEAVNAQLLEALDAMLTHMGMDEDDWNKPTFDQARAAIKAAKGEA